MTAAEVQGARLVLPLRQLVPRTLHLDQPVGTSLAGWVAAVRSTSEACLVLDANGRVAAMSHACGKVLDVDPVQAVGSLLVDLVLMVDFSVAGVPLTDPEHQCPPLRALRTGGMARALVRLRLGPGRLVTYDAVGVPLAGGAGALGFLVEV
ncbi:MAG: hypothetical protein WCD35_17975 [Mycobacteriales bacterium]